MLACTHNTMLNKTVLFKSRWHKALKLSSDRMLAACRQNPAKHFWDLQSNSELQTEPEDCDAERSGTGVLYRVSSLRFVFESAAFTTYFHMIQIHIASARRCSRSSVETERREEPWNQEGVCVYVCVCGGGGFISCQGLFTITGTDEKLCIRTTPSQAHTSTWRSLSLTLNLTHFNVSTREREKKKSGEVKGCDGACTLSVECVLLKVPWSWLSVQTL